MKHISTLLLSCIFVLISLSAFAQLPPYVPTNGLVAWYPFNGTTLDESGHSNHGTNSGATLTSDRFSTANAAYSFNGSASIITSFGTSITNPKTYTMSGWFKVTAIAQAGIFALKPGPGSISGYGVVTNTANNTVTGNHYANNGFYNVNTPFPVNACTFVAISYDSTMLRLYLNGVKVDSTVVPYPIPSVPSIDMTIGNWIGFPGVNNYFTGLIDDVGAWTRALSDSEVVNLYTASIPTTPTGIKNLSNQHHVTVTNPIADKLVIDVKRDEDLGKYTIVDMSGKVVGSGTLSAGVNVVNTIRLTQGVYFIIMRNEVARVVKL